MRAVRSALAALIAVALSATGAAATETTATSGPADDAVVIAVVDGNFSPYHWDFDARRMPQQLDADPANDLPLDQPPDTWLPGFPDPATFASYNALPITRAASAGQNVDSLATKDAAVWNSVRQSTRAETNYNWIPGTKIIGALDYSGNKIRAAAPANDAHGAGTSSVSAGNLNGTCPECLVVLVTYGGNDREAATDWAMSQPWIDVVTHSYGYSTTAYDKIYNGSNLPLQKAAVERGQAVLWSASNGQANAFDAPTTTYYSSSKGPDWLVTVGASSPSGGNYTGSGKTVDLASVGSSYPSMGGTSATGKGTFSGTSNATPVVAGMYARSLLNARRQLAGPSRTQDAGVIASGTPVICGAVRPDCELGDGLLTRQELTTRLFEGAIQTPQGPNAVTEHPSPMTTTEYDYASEGYGTYFARANSVQQWQQEEARINGPMNGTAAVTPRPAGEREWMVVDSYCRQELWGGWTGGSYVAGQTPLPGASPTWPIRSALEATCPQLFPLPPG